MPAELLVEIVALAGFCFIAGLIDSRAVYLPALFALVYPSQALAAGFSAMVVSMLFGAISYLVKAR